MSSEKDKEAKDERERGIQEVIEALIDAPEPPKPKSPHEFIQEQMRREKARPKPKQKPPAK
jgi:hypothetical protein